MNQVLPSRSAHRLIERYCRRPRHFRLSALEINHPESFPRIAPLDVMEAAGLIDAPFALFVDSVLAVNGFQ